MNKLIQGSIKIKSKFEISICKRSKVLGIKCCFPLLSCTFLEYCKNKNQMIQVNWIMLDQWRHYKLFKLNLGLK